MLLSARPEKTRPSMALPLPEIPERLMASSSVERRDGAGRGGVSIPGTKWRLGRACIASVLVLIACGDDPVEPMPPAEVQGACMAPDPRFDGVYGVTFSVDGEQTAVGAVTVADGRFLGDIMGLNAHVIGEGCVVADGKVIFERVDSAGGIPVTVSAVIDDGVVGGEYTVATPQGMLLGEITGSLDNRSYDESHTEFDGEYDLLFYLGEDVRSVARFEVINSGFVGRVPIDAGDFLEMQGYVTSDGLAVLTGVEGTLAETMAEARLDQDTFEGTGVYRWGDFAGRFTAVRRAE